MSCIDPLKVMRNAATLQAYRQYQRALWAAGQPWLVIGLIVIALQVSLFLFALLHNGFGSRDLSLLFNLLMFTYAVCFAVAGIRIWLYRRSHPFVLPEAPPAP